MPKTRHTMPRIITIRCAGCRKHYPQYHIKHVRRLQAPGELPLCRGCWYDALQAARAGAYDLAALLEDFAARTGI